MACGILHRTSKGTLLNTDMIADCAVEPEVMARWEYFQSLHGDFGVGQGRLMCEFPNKWRRLVLERATELEEQGINTARQAAMLLDQFQHGAFRRGLVASGRTFPSDLKWRIAAQTTMPPFDLIIQSENPSNASELKAGEFLRLVPPFARSRQTEVRRSASDLIACGWPCFRRCKELYLVDPYFRPRDAKFGRVLGHLLARMDREASQPKRLEVHTSIPGDYRTDVQKGNWNNWAEEHLPSGWKLKVVHWERLETGGTLHARYILTDIGGIDYNWGTDEDPAEHSQVALLDDQFWGILYNRFSWPDGRVPQAFITAPERIFEIVG